tara:strand:- start:32 stop:367 length:336 start_codon:yes stop_codon:yes gene_type:complete
MSDFADAEHNYWTFINMKVDTLEYKGHEYDLYPVNPTQEQKDIYKSLIIDLNDEDPYETACIELMTFEGKEFYTDGSGGSYSLWDKDTWEHIGWADAEQGIIERDSLKNKQ